MISYARSYPKLLGKSQAEGCSFFPNMFQKPPSMIKEIRGHPKDKNENFWQARVKGYFLDMAASKNIKERSWKVREQVAPLE